MSEREIAAVVDAELSHGDARSMVYREAMLDVLRFRFHGIPLAKPFKPGSVEFDAWAAGNERGHLLYRRLKYSDKTT